MKERTITMRRWSPIVFYPLLSLYLGCLALMLPVLAQSDASWQRSMAAGDTAYQRGQTAEAETLYLAALESLKEAGPEDPRLAATLNTLALFYHGQQQHAAAASLYEQVLRLLEPVLPPEHPSLVTTLNNLAVLCEAQGDYARAELLYQRALGSLETAQGPEYTANMAATLGNYADLLRKLQRQAEAERLAARAEALWAQQGQQRSPK
jgi:tetratricopeptide (TPR) repeat protein